MDITLVADLCAPYPADVFLFHPSDQQIFVVGTYWLDEATKKRHGKLCVYKLQLDNLAAIEGSAEKLQDIDCDAILDMKWYDSRLFVAHSTGSLSIFDTMSSSDISSFKLALLKRKTFIETDTLVMSLSVSARGILTSHSDGTIAILTHDLRLQNMLHVSELEVWIQSWGADSHLIYTGSDDGLFAAWDIREAHSRGSHTTSTWSNTRSHGAGVTAIVPDKNGRDILTGSYDDRIRRFDVRNLRKTVIEKDLSGGVWRIIPRERDELVACCTYDGAKVIQNENFEILKTWTGHDSMVYGGDVTGDLIGTCSFYDKRVCIWT